jgi:hypothetical protein
MAKDPAYLFYPGDVLQEIGMLNTKQKGVYLVLLCLQKEKICFTHEELMFIMSELCDVEKSIMFKILAEKEGKYFIGWLQESIEKRKEYSKGRSENRKGKSPKTIDKPKKKTYKKDVINTSKTYDDHMENEIENVNEDINENKGGVGEKENTVLEKCKEYYQEFILQKTNAKPKWDGTQIEALKSIIKYLNTLETVKNDENLVYSWRYILKRWPLLDDYQSKKIKLTEINSDIIKIIYQIKNNPRNNGTTTKKPLASTIKVIENASFGDL